MSAMIAEHNVGALIVSDDAGSLCGIVSERDIARAVMRFPRDVATRRGARNHDAQGHHLCHGGQGPSTSSTS